MGKQDNLHHNRNMTRSCSYSISIVCLLLFVPLSVNAQVIVKGVIKDKQRCELPGVNIIEKGTRNGTISDKEGCFTLQVQDYDARLIISFIGYKTREIKVDKDSMEIILKEECYADWFDHQYVTLYATSGLPGNPVGGRLDISYPAFFKQTTLMSTLSYRTNLKGNYVFQSQLAYRHLLVHQCNFSLDIVWNYHQFEWEDLLLAKSHSVEAELHLSNILFRIRYIRLLLGYTNLDFRENGAREDFRNGAVIGLGIPIGKPLHLFLTGKSFFYQNRIAWEFTLAHSFKKIKTFARFYALDPYREFSVGIGYRFNYRFKH